MREMFEDWFAQSELNQDADTEKKEALFAAFEAGVKAQSEVSVPAGKLQEEVTNLQDRIDTLNAQLSSAQNRIQELSDTPANTPGHPDNPVGQQSNG